MPETPDIPDELPLPDEAAVMDEAAAPTSDGETRETTSVPETTKEHDPMLDVHPAHHAASTWRDFFIHIATIVIGLLIAVGLEQAVEAVHHHHQREDLIADFRGECERNITLADLNIKNMQGDRAWEKTWLDELRKSALDPRIAAVVLPARPSANQYEGVTRSVWAIGKSNGTAALLPETLAEMYDRTDHESDEVYVSADHYTATLRHLSNLARADGFSFNARVASPAISVELSFLQRTELISALADLIGDDDALIRWTAILRGASQAVVDNVGSRDAMGPYLRRAQAQAAVE
jgi:hypothetical protein